MLLGNKYQQNARIVRIIRNRHTLPQTFCYIPFNDARLLHAIFEYDHDGQHQQQAPDDTRHQNRHSRELLHCQPNLTKREVILSDNTRDCYRWSHLKRMNFAGRARKGVSLTNVSNSFVRTHHTRLAYCYRQGFTRL